MSCRLHPSTQPLFAVALFILTWFYLTGVTEVMSDIMQQKHGLIPTMSNNVKLIAAFDNDEQHDTSVIITSALIPAHPSIRMINDTISSLHHLRGLSPTAPLFITIDGLPEGASAEDKERLAQYVSALKQTYKESHQTILVSDLHLHLTENVKVANDLVTTKFLYLLQHDLKFIRDVNHPALVKSMREYPEVLRLVRFNRRNNIPYGFDDGSCFGNATIADHVNGLHFTKTPGWSDQNHIAIKAYYDEVLTMLGSWKGFMETPRRGNAQRDCARWGPHLYGARDDSPYIAHVHGRHNQDYRRALRGLPENGVNLRVRV